MKWSSQKITGMKLGSSLSCVSNKTCNPGEITQFHSYKMKGREKMITKAISCLNRRPSGLMAESSDSRRDCVF